MKLIKNGRVIDPKSQFDALADILIDGQKIVAIGQDLTREDAEIIDATGKIVAPGLIDIHVHFREPGQTHKEDIHTGSLAAARGGFTTVVMMANTNPTVSTVETLTEVLSSASRENIHVKSVATITDKFDGQTLTDFEALLKAGAVGFSDDGIPFTDAGQVRKAMQKAVDFDTILALHEEDPQLTGVLGINDGAVAHQCGVTGAPTVSEYSMVARDAMLALDTKARVHFQHLSAGESVDVVRFAKAMGARITAEVTPQHFSITEDAILTHGTNAKLNPPLRRTSDIEKLIIGLQDGTIDVIATDHAPHTHAEKDQEITKAPSGMTGLETSLSLGLTHLVAPGHLSVMALLEKMTSNPAQVLGVDAGYLAENGPADLVIFDADVTREVTDDFASKASNSPFVGDQLQGVIAYTICDGDIVYQS
ncbi:MAG: dihydroorotase [Lactococcus raffinolactis]|jgi:dihydroorotase|uniref:Dihydroorotase n=1 Tax=Pseudolactococcus raffinolactis TaxID=1366 RepID=A0A290Q0T7_9LACT|nr:dihydroorotase [Lactococcus raffinolactis]MBR2542313.1 dihydroorotase [Lactococcus sp.]ATC62053.1 dihydroorotase [Lactococcus raffinolactis]MBW9329837.1 dihydroorotase [Lactococcus raffinolactis]MDG4960757.1 dihydroorotase [Lactococcus raffinolactis]MDN5414021.1 dihydroorotase [Lactococcus raffinolactis]